MMIRLDLDDPSWRELVAHSTNATAFHHPAWPGMLSECYGYAPFILAIRSNSGGVAAGLAALDVKNFLGRRWISLPFTDSCPPLFTPEISQEVFSAALEDYRTAEGAPGMEVRAPLPGPRSFSRPLGVRHRLDLARGLEEIERGFTQSQVRRNIERARREGIVVRRAESKEDLVQTFYGLHVKTRARQGVPVQPKRFFRLLWERLIEPGLGLCLIAHSGVTPAAAAVFLSFNRTVIYKFGASDEKLLATRPNHIIFWEAISWAVDAGFQELDFGRTDFPNQGLRQFKTAWGAVEEPLVYTTFGRAAREHESGALQVLGPLIRHSPTPVCRVLGKVLYKYAA